MQVRLIQSMAGAGRSWNAGDLFDATDADEAGRLIEAGIAEPAGGASLEAAVVAEPKKKGNGK